MTRYIISIPAVIDMFVDGPTGMDLEDIRSEVYSSIQAHDLCGNPIGEMNFEHYIQAPLSSVDKKPLIQVRSFLNNEIPEDITVDSFQLT